MPPPMYPYSRYRFRRNDYVGVNYNASAAPVEIRAKVGVRYDNGQFEEFTITVSSFTTDRTIANAYVGTNVTTSPGNRQFQFDGYVEYAQVLLLGATVLKRGQFYLRLVVVNPGDFEVQSLCDGYIYTHFTLSLGMHIESGPGGGEGFLSWVSLAANIAPVDVTRVLAAAFNTIRKIHGFVWYYKAAAVAATRTLDVQLRSVGLAPPTGITNPIVWTRPTVSLTTGEVGYIYVTNPGRGDGFSSANDNGTITYESTDTKPLPFPYWVTEDDLADLIFDVGAADAADRHSIYLLQEDWLVM